MAISLGGFRQKQAKEKEAKEIAAQVERERKKEGELGGLMSLLSVPLGFMTGGISSALFGGLGKGLFGSIAGGLGKAAVGAGLKGVSESALRGAGMGADTSKIRSTSKYGFGRQETEDIRKRMEEGIEERSAVRPESLLTSVLMDYAGQFVHPGEESAQQLATEKGTDSLARNLGFGKKGFSEKVTKKGLEDNPWLLEDDSWSLGAGSTIDKTQAFDSSGVSEGLFEDYKGVPIGGTEDAIDAYGDPVSEEFSFQEGGQVPHTIAGFFEMKGKSLGGSNKKSLAEILGRK